VHSTRNNKESFVEYVLTFPNNDIQRLHHRPEYTAAAARNKIVASLGSSTGQAALFHDRAPFPWIPTTEEEDQDWATC
jgi:hypothetical protein